MARFTALMACIMTLVLPLSQLSAAFQICCPQCDVVIACIDDIAVLDLQLCSAQTALQLWSKQYFLARLAGSTASFKHARCLSRQTRRHMAQCYAAEVCNGVLMHMSALKHDGQMYRHETVYPCVCQPQSIPGRCRDIRQRTHAYVSPEHSPQMYRH